MVSFIKKYWIFAVMILCFLIFGLVIYFIGPEKIVSFVGVENTYLVAFLFAVLGGLSSITGVSFFAAIATFAAGGSHPLLLGFAGGLGIFISDSVFFFMARYGVSTVREKSKPHRYFEKIKRLPKWALLLTTYTYLGFTPFPNDLLMVFLAFSDIKYKQLMPIILLGGMTVVTIAAYLGNFI